MKECIGMILIFSAIGIGVICLFGDEFETKEKILGIIIFEIFICLITIGAYLSSLQY